MQAKSNWRLSAPTRNNPNPLLIHGQMAKLLMRVAAAADDGDGFTICLSVCLSAYLTVCVRLVIAPREKVNSQRFGYFPIRRLATIAVIISRQTETDKRTDRQTDRRTYKCSDRLRKTNGQTDGQTDKRTDRLRQINGQTDKRTDRLRQINGQTDRQTHR